MTPTPPPTKPTTGKEGEPVRITVVSPGADKEIKEQLEKFTGKKPWPADDRASGNNDGIRDN